MRRRKGEESGASPHALTWKLKLNFHQVSLTVWIGELDSICQRSNGLVSTGPHFKKQRPVQLWSGPSGSKLLGWLIILITSRGECKKNENLHGKHIRKKISSWSNKSIFLLLYAPTLVQLRPASLHIWMVSWKLLRLLYLVSFLSLPNRVLQSTFGHRQRRGGAFCRFHGLLLCLERSGRLYFKINPSSSNSTMVIMPFKTLGLKWTPNIPQRTHASRRDVLPASCDFLSGCQIHSPSKRHFLFWFPKKIKSMQTSSGPPPPCSPVISSDQHFEFDVLKKRKAMEGSIAESISKTAPCVTMRNKEV